MNTSRTATPSPTIATGTLFSYFFPELITVGILYIGLEIINIRFLACTNIALCNETLFISNTLFHFLTKVAEGFSVGLVIMCGQYNGAQEYEKTGKVLSDAFWTTMLVGAAVALSLYLGAHAIYAFYDVPPEIAQLGVPYLQLRSIAVFFAFIYFGIVGFLRGIKNPKIPMTFFMLGAVVYLVFDYALIYGAWGFPALGLKGSALATVIQYGFMLCIAILYIVFNPQLRKYGISLFSRMQLSNIKDLVHVSWPVMIDKASLAFCSIYLSKMLGCTAKMASPEAGHLLYNSFTVLKTMERVGILPALAFAQVISYLVSNDYKIAKFKTIKNNIKKVLFFACILTALSTLLFCLKPYFFLWIFNKHTAYNELFAYTVPFIAALIVFDVLQLVLAGALRGAADVKTVMMTRLLVTGLIFIPLSYTLSLFPFKSLLTKFIVLYSSYHLALGLMGLIYILRFKSGFWKKQSLED